MTLSDLKTGMIVTLRNGIECVVFRDTESSMDRSDHVILNREKGVWERLNSYMYNLTNKHNREFDIVKVERPPHPYAFQDIDYGRDGRVLLWECKEVKKMTVAEISKELGYEVEIVG